MLRKINLKDINYYLSIRNKKINRKNSISPLKINHLDHYIWWFTSKRKSFVYSERGVDIMIFFHDLKKINNKDYIIPGWYNAADKSNFFKILKGLKLQKKKLSKLSIKNLSIIKKDNISMINFSKYLGWNKINDNKKIKVIKKNFKLEENNNLFKYYLR